MFERSGVAGGRKRVDGRQRQVCISDRLNDTPADKTLWLQRAQITLASNDHAKALTSMEMALRHGENKSNNLLSTACRLYTYDAADDLRCVDLGSSRPLYKKNNKNTHGGA